MDGRSPLSRNQAKISKMRMRPSCGDDVNSVCAVAIGEWSHDTKVTRINIHHCANNYLKWQKNVFWTLHLTHILTFNFCSCPIYLHILRPTTRGGDWDTLASLLGSCHVVHLYLQSIWHHRACIELCHGQKNNSLSIDGSFPQKSAQIK